MKVSYFSKWNKTGTHFNQCLKINKKELKMINRSIKNTKENAKDWYIKMWLEDEIVFNNNIAFLNLTKVSIIMCLFNKNKRILHRNTYLEMEEIKK